MRDIFTSPLPEPVNLATSSKRIILNKRIHEDLLYRLRWSVLATLDDIEIATGPYDSTTNVPLFRYTLSNESITNRLFSQIRKVRTSKCLDRVDNDYKEEY